MNVIHSYIINLTSEQEVGLPNSAKIIEVKEQHGHLCLWAIIPIGDVAWEKRKIKIVGTGEEYDTTLLKYINTVHCNSLVWHVFERSVG